MIPAHLTANPFPDSDWSPADKPVAVLDGVPQPIRRMEKRCSANIAYIVGANQRTFDRAMDLMSARTFHFYEMRVSDISALESHNEINELTVHWNTKIVDISAICRIPKLRALVLTDTPKVADLRPLSGCNSLEILEYSGGVWNRNRAESLEPIGRIPSLKALRLLNIAVNSGGLKPLSEAKTLSEMELSNQFPTDDYAFLAARLPHVKCNLFRPYVKLESAIDGKDTMVVGRRKPFLNMKHDSARLEKYVREFEALRRSYAERSNLRQHNHRDDQ